MRLKRIWSSMCAILGSLTVVACSTSDDGRGGAGAGGADAGPGGADAMVGGAGGRGCSQGTFAVGTMLAAQGFQAHEGAAVRAAFAADIDPEPMTAETTVRAGRFEFDFLFPSETCNLGASSFAGGALYVDVDADGNCDLATDLLFAWSARGGPPGPYTMVELTPQSRCSLTTHTDRHALESAQHLCPDIGDCLDFCGDGDLLGGGGFPAVCIPADAGSADDDGGAASADVDAG